MGGDVYHVSMKKRADMSGGLSWNLSSVADIPMPNVEVQAIYNPTLGVDGISLSETILMRRPTAKAR
jgi:hypothetical protein